VILFDPGHDSTSMNEHDNMPSSTDLSSAAQLMGVKVDSQSVSQSVSQGFYSRWGPASPFDSIAVFQT